MKSINLLSVDWDYFFPNGAQFDWGARETNMFIDFLWTTRCNSKSMNKPHAQALDVMHPDDEYKKFWISHEFRKVPWVCLAESHEDIIPFIMTLPPVKICINYDAHHDLGYGQTEDLDCGNWAECALRKKMIERYHLVYSKWRGTEEDKHPEVGNHPLLKDPHSLFHKPEGIRFDAIFICRSGSWTPPWSDEKWIEFIQVPQRWNVTHCARAVLKPRQLDMVSARKIQAVNQEQVNQMLNAFIERNQQPK